MGLPHGAEVAPPPRRGTFGSDYRLSRQLRDRPCLRRPVERILCLHRHEHPGIPFSVLLAFVVALLAFIPLVGGLIAAVVVILVALTAGWQTAVIYAIAYFAYLQFEAYFISPRIMQRAVAVPGAVAVISVIAGEACWVSRVH